MNERKRETPIEEKLTLEEARARVSEFKGMKKVEGKGGGAAITLNRRGHTGAQERAGRGEEPPKEKR